MKHASVLVLSALTTIGVMPAYAVPVSYLHSNSIAINNIAVMQHSIMLNAFNNFDSSMATSLYSHPAALPDDMDTDEEAIQNIPKKHDPADKYGKMPVYGEYGDDGTVFSSGRSGGEFPVSNYNWIDWQHTQDYAKFDGFSKIDSRNDIISIGFPSDPHQIAGGYSVFGGFGGLTFAHENNDDIKLDEVGQYLGLYQGYHVNGFNIMAAANIGEMFDDAETSVRDYDFTNLWAGVAINASYDISLDDESTVQPGVYAGYTWIHSTGYDSATAHGVSFDDFNLIELSPSLRAITHIAGGWYGTMSARYVFNFADGGNAHIAGVTVPELELLDYCEYGLSFERSAETFNIAVSLNRRDGGRTGWNGGIQIRYLF